MANFKGTIITTKGHALIAKAVANTATINFTKLATSSHDYTTSTNSALEALINLSDIKQYSTIDKVQAVNTSYKVFAKFTNKDLTESYYVRAIGLFATDPDEGEILYSITVAENADWFPADNGVNCSGINLDLNTGISNTSNVTLNVNYSGYATNEDIKEVNDQLVEATGYGIVSGLSVAPQSTPNMTVNVTEGVLHMPSGARLSPVANDALAINASDSTNPRKDIVFIKNDGTIGYLSGTPASSPTAPSIPEGAFLLYEIDVPAGATSITNSDLVDKRKIKNTADNLKISLDLVNSQLSEITNSKVDKVTGKGLSTNDYDNTEKAKVALIENKADITYVDSKVGSIGSTKTFKGSILFASLPTSGNTNGDYYYVTDKTTNYCWNGTTWVDIGNNINIGDNTVTSAKRTVLGTKVIGFATTLDYSTTAKTLTYTGLWINYNNKSVHVTDGVLDLSISSTNAVIVFDSLSGTLKNLGDSTTGITEDQILLGIISLSIPYNSIMYTNMFSINGSGIIDSTKLANGAGKFSKRTPIGSVAFAYGTYTWDTDNKTFTCASDAWINYGVGSGITLASISLSITSNSFIVFDISTSSIKVVGNYSSISENQILLCFLNPSHWDKSWNVGMGRILVKQGTVTQALEDAKHWDTQIPIGRLQTAQVKNKKYACLGDSITSDQVSGVGTTISTKLETTLVGNFATGGSTCSDWHTGDTNNTAITLTTPQNTDTNDNVLSNQVRRLLQYTTALGSQITWIHPIDGSFSLDTSVGTGLGNTSNIPDIIYIAISTNDGKNASVPINDDTDTVFGQTYSQLTRNSIASALRWAIETLQCAYPNANIFVASPLQTNCSNSWMNFANSKIKHDIIQKVCQFCSVHFVDSFNESGYSTMKAKTGVLSVDGIHPNANGVKYISTFVSSEINRRFITR